VTAPAACAPRSPAVMHASDDRSRMPFPRLQKTHAGPPGNHDVEPPNPTCARLIWKTACDYRWERVLFRCAQMWYVQGGGWCAARCGRGVYEFCWNRGERVRRVPFLCARGQWCVVRGAWCVVRGDKAGCAGLKRRPGLKATGRRLVERWTISAASEETATARRLRYGLRQQGSAASPRLDRGCRSLRELHPRQLTCTPSVCSRQSPVEEIGIGGTPAPTMPRA
jgi:hypothetical protein